MFEDEEEKEELKPHLVNTIEPIVIGPFRFIKPYLYTFHCSAKARWIGKPLIDVFEHEFKHWSHSTLVERIQSGYITVNKHHITIDYIIQNRDFIEHTILRRESPIYNLPIEKLGETADYVAYHKPSSLPVYSTGGYYYNSLINMVDPQYHPVHRLDKVTSGIVVFAKSETSARHFGQMLLSKKIHKTYIARVIGSFPAGETKVYAPIRESSVNRSLRECGEGGKESLTLFKLISTNGSESIVECHPITGRTHQIRVHLSYLGYPISNDVKYGGKEPVLSSDEKKALEEAKKRGLWPPDTTFEDENPAVSFGIYLHSCHYQSDEFDFKAPLPKWTELPEKKSKCKIQ
ncbi:pseudouridine synthase [Histomonas meleagridis]|uniref:pseudouridine synthase n=1 Tax=Histomonas meleagridis TaxID=135588 RepID=UPI00355A1A69|nr:pseudouridine synthase [Histomonas meleagridis]KAH0800900.1 pseudouridine synthase [Histomonas meleagridis]